LIGGAFVLVTWGFVRSPSSDYILAAART